VKSFNLSTTLVAVGLLMAAPALAQTTPSGTTTAQKQHTDGGDSPDNPRATDASAAAWHKQHIDGGDAPDNPRATDASAAAWHKQHIDALESPNNPQSLHKQQAQSLAHSAGPMPDGVSKQQ
jgi:hypothetical protein